MRDNPTDIAERGRVTTGPYGIPHGNGCNGAFFLTVKGADLKIIVSNGMGWDHVSVSAYDRCPTWDEMCVVKNQFWRADECVIQFHPPKHLYINCHPFVLHLWKQHGV
jgi:hypothetical protein